MRTFFLVFIELVILAGILYLGETVLYFKVEGSFIGLKGCLVINQGYCLEGGVNGFLVPALRNQNKAFA